MVVDTDVEVFILIFNRFNILPFYSNYVRTLLYDVVRTKSCISKILDVFCQFKM
jgi:hypothetical protein